MPEQTRPSLLSVRNLTVAFGKDNVSDPVVKGLDLDVHKGETVAIVGESGSGKSVTALSMMRLIEFGNGNITDGTINLVRRDGKTSDICKLDDESARTLRGDEISMIFQEPMTSLTCRAVCANV